MLSFEYPQSSNLGDDIQTLAAINLLGECDFVDRDNLRSTDKSGKLILNGWWTHDPGNAWPPPNQIDCLPISLYVNDKSRPYFEKYKSWFDGKEVLARDANTNEWLQSIGVNSKFGGCLTLTLPRNEVKRDGIVFVDLKNGDYGISPDITVTHNTKSKNGEERRAKATEILKLYQSARLVVTSRLHCALPCAAMGTPVVCMPPKFPGGGLDPRFSGMENFITLATRVEVKDAIENELRKPRDYSDAIHFFAKRLKERVNQWK